MAPGSREFLVYNFFGVSIADLGCQKRYVPEPFPSAVFLLTDCFCGGKSIGEHQHPLMSFYAEVKGINGSKCGRDHENANSICSSSFPGNSIGYMLSKQAVQKSWGLGRMLFRPSILIYDRLSAVRYFLISPVRWLEAISSYRVGVSIP